MNCCKPTRSPEPQQVFHPIRRQDWGYGEDVSFSSELLMQSWRCVVTVSLMDHCSITEKNHFVTLSLPHALNVITLNHYGNTLLAARFTVCSNSNDLQFNLTVCCTTPRLIVILLFDSREAWTVISFPSAFSFKLLHTCSDLEVRVQEQIGSSLLSYIKWVIFTFQPVSDANVERVLSSVNSILKHGLHVNPTLPTIPHESIILDITQRSCFGI